MRWKRTTLLLALATLALSLYPASRLGSEFMPTLNEGTLFYMPTSLPGMSITKPPSCCKRRTRSSRAFPRSPP